MSSKLSKGICMSVNMAKKLTEILESDLQVVFAVKYFRQFSWGLERIEYFRNTAAYESWCEGVIQIPKCRGIELRQFLYHELGHALLAEYEIPKTMFKKFTSRASSGIKYSLEIGKFSQRERREGFISGYAVINKEEDFCETFSAWVLNAYKTTGTVQYDGESLNLTKDIKLKAKFLAVAQVVKYCQFIEKQYNN